VPARQVLVFRLGLDPPSLRPVARIPRPTTGAGAASAARGGGVSQLRYSPDGSTLAVAYAAGPIHVLEAPPVAPPPGLSATAPPEPEAGGVYLMRGVCAGHATAALALDWAETGEALQSATGPAEGHIMFWSTAPRAPGAGRGGPTELEPIQRLVTLRGALWATMSSPLAWPALHADAAAADRSPDRSILVLAGGPGERRAAVWAVPYAAPGRMRAARGGGGGGHSAAVRQVRVVPAHGAGLPGDPPPTVASRGGRRGSMARGRAGGDRGKAAAGGRSGRGGDADDRLMALSAGGPDMAVLQWRIRPSAPVPGPTSLSAGARRRLVRKPAGGASRARIGRDPRAAAREST
jgi:hypothetical protein